MKKKENSQVSLDCKYYKYNEINRVINCEWFKILQFYFDHDNFLIFFTNQHFE